MIRVTFIFFMSLLVCGEAARSQTPAVYLHVKRITSMKDTTVNWKTSYGSYDKDFTRSVGVSIFLRNMQKDPSKVTLEWFFIAKELSTRQMFVFDKGQEELLVDQAQPIQLTKISEPINSSVQRYMALGQREKSGSQISGYIVRVRSGDKIIAVDASSRPLEQTGRNHLDLREVFGESLVEKTPSDPVPVPIAE